MRYSANFVNSLFYRTGSFETVPLQAEANYSKPALMLARCFSQAFKGDGERWESARYREFRVDENGPGLLASLREPNLEKM